MAKMPGIAKFCSHVLHLESEVVFGSLKRKPDMPIGDEWESQKAWSSHFYLSTSWNKVLSNSNYWLFFDQHTRGVFFQPLGNGCNSSCTRQTANLHWHPNNEQLRVYYNFKGSHLTGNNNSIPRIWMHHYFRSGDCAKHWAVHDHHWLLSDHSYPYFKGILALL
jgi:hypothetical protein